MEVEKILVALQEFHLDVDAMREEAEKMHQERKVIEILPPTPGTELIKKLRTKEYTVFVSAEVVNGIPKSLVVSIEIGPGRKVKSDFYEAAESLGIKWFRSGCCYIRSGH